ncbi:MAG: alanine racemase [Pseudomonadales bacterium]|nr:alanine racemase [Candidatus Woesebacteria bacterium]MCB9802349.1 alanine racemase [Pseudomonadales bacterium]
MLSLFRPIEYRSLNIIQVSASALQENYTALSSYKAGVAIAPVLKSNAYGHGLKEVGGVLDAAAPPFFVVDSLYEAYELQNAGITTRPLISGYTNPENFQTKPIQADVMVWDIETIKALQKYQPQMGLHLFVDTGMHREGVLLKDLSRFLEGLGKLEEYNIAGICTHFSDADDTKSNKTTQQIKKFQEAQDILAQHNIHPRWRHIAASAGLTHVSGAVCNLARVGLASYGIPPAADYPIKLKPALELFSTIAQVKTLSAGEAVGYNSTYVCTNKTTIAVLPIGYYDGVDRRLSNKGFVKIGDSFCPIVGRVSMNITTVDVSSVPDVTVGQRVCVISGNPADKNSLVSLAEMADDIPYNLLAAGLSQSTRRVVVE